MHEDADRARMRASGMDGSLPLDDFYRDRFPAQRKRKGHRTAIGHLARMLGRPPRLDDLTAETIRAVLDALAAAGRTDHTLRSVRGDLASVAIVAADAGLIERPAVQGHSYVPPGPTRPAWTVADLNRLFGSARTMEGEFSGIPAGRWWTALLLVMLDTGCPLSDALAAGPEAYDRRGGALAAGWLVYALHPLTIAALDAIAGEDRERLLPWPMNHSMLYREYRTLLYRAGLPHLSGNLFARLQATGRRGRDVLDRINLRTAFRPVPGKPHFPRPPRSERPKPRPKADRPQIVGIAAADPGRTLRTFLETLYIPRRLAKRSVRTHESHRDAERQLCAYAACDVTLDQLSDDLLESFALWKAQSTAPATVNKLLRTLLAQWRYAWKKKKVETQPRDVEFLPEPKRIPDAWSLEEFGRILAACETLRGSVNGIPARLFWPALLLTLYDTGLRIGALTSLDATALDLDRGWLTVRFGVQKQNADQVFRLHPDTLLAVRDTLPEERPLLFPPLTMQAMLTTYTGILKAAGLPFSHRDKFHKLRRTSATYLADAAGEQAAFRHLGHSSIQVTRAYLDPRKMTRNTTAADVLPRPHTPQPPEHPR